MEGTTRPPTKPPMQLFVFLIDVAFLIQTSRLRGTGFRKVERLKRSTKGLFSLPNKLFLEFISFTSKEAHLQGENHSLAALHATSQKTAIILKP